MSDPSFPPREFTHHALDGPLGGDTGEPYVRGRWLATFAHSIDLDIPVLESLHLRMGRKRYTRGFGKNAGRSELVHGD